MQHTAMPRAMVMVIQINLLLVVTPHACTWLNRCRQDYPSEEAHSGLSAPGNLYRYDLYRGIISRLGPISAGNQYNRGIKEVFSRLFVL